MSKGQTFQAEMLDLVLNNTGIACIGDTTGLVPSTADGCIYISLHCADPGETGDQTTCEVLVASYGQYARQGICRDDGASGWAVTVASPATATNEAAVTYTVMSTGTGITASHFALGTDITGTGKLLYSAALDSSLAISNGVTPEFAIGALEVTEE